MIIHDMMFDVNMVIGIGIIIIIIIIIITIPNRRTHLRCGNIWSNQFQ